VNLSHFSAELKGDWPQVPTSAVNLLYKNYRPPMKYWRVIKNYTPCFRKKHPLILLAIS